MKTSIHYWPQNQWSYNAHSTHPQSYHHKAEMFGQQNKNIKWIYSWCRERTLRHRTRESPKRNNRLDTNICSSAQFRSWRTSFHKTPTVASISKRSVEPKICLNLIKEWFFPERTYCMVNSLRLRHWNCNLDMLKSTAQQTGHSTEKE